MQRHGRNPRPMERVDYVVCGVLAVVMFAAYLTQQQTGWPIYQVLYIAAGGSLVITVAVGCVVISRRSSERRRRQSSKSADSP